MFNETYEQRHTYREYEKVRESASSDHTKTLTHICERADSARSYRDYVPVCIISVSISVCVYIKSANFTWCHTHTPTTFFIRHRIYHMSMSVRQNGKNVFILNRIKHFTIFKYRSHSISTQYSCVRARLSDVNVCEYVCVCGTSQLTWFNSRNTHTPTTFFRSSTC